MTDINKPFYDKQRAQEGDRPKEPWNGNAHNTDSLSGAHDAAAEPELEKLLDTMIPLGMSVEHLEKSAAVKDAIRHLFAQRGVLRPYSEADVFAVRATALALDLLGADPSGADELHDLANRLSASLRESRGS